MRKRGRPFATHVDFIPKRFWEVMHYRNLSLRKLNNDEKCEVSEKTIRRAIKNEWISPEILNKLSSYLGVDPLFFRGYYKDFVTMELLTAAKGNNNDTILQSE